MRLLCLYFILIFVIFGISAFKEIPDQISNQVEELKTGQIPQALTKIIKDFKKIKDKQLANEIFCQTCDLVLTQIIEYRRIGASKNSMIDFLKKLCKVFTDWGATACDGYINIEIDTVLFIIDNKKELKAQRICGLYFQSKPCIDPNANKWIIPIPPKNKTQQQHKSRHYRNETPLKILHLTDFHYDPLYAPGSNADCDLPLCCEESSGPPSNSTNAAGLWGDYRVCDTPWHAITNFTFYLNNTKEKFDWIYYTGDIISHRSWATDKDANTKAVKQLFQHFNESFGKTPVYPILGNHEPHPTDFWSYSGGHVNITPSISTQWMFDLVANEWKRWLPKETIETIKAGGYYTVLMRPKLRLVALNSNVCFVSNLWLIYEDEDPYGQLAWLVKVLSEAEQKKETVHIISHIPPGELLCAQQWSNQFRKIVQRFAPIIAAQFNGHTHLDEIRFFRDPNNTNKIINVAFNAGSFTTFVSFNPNYRTYQVDTDNYRVLDYDHYTYNLTEANLSRKPPNWYKLYSFKSAYGLKNTTNESFEDLIGRMSKNKTLTKQYFRFQGRESVPYLSQGCDDLCLSKLVCTLTAVETNDAIKCQQMMKNKLNHSI